MARQYLREWLALSPADIPLVLSAGCCAGMYFAHDFALNLVLTGGALFFAALTCLLGMKNDPRLSRSTNLAKKVVYPLLVVAVVAAVYVNFMLWHHESTPRGSPGRPSPGKPAPAKPFKLYTPKRG